MLTTIFFLFTIFNLSYAETQNTSGAWWGTFLNTNLKNDFNFWAETQLRYNSSKGQLGQILYRTGILQTLNKNHNIGYLYGFIQSPISREHRLALQHSMKYSQSFSHRVRLEFRDLEDNDDEAYRFRYLVRYSKEKLLIWNELFLNLKKTSWNGNKLTDRNRLFIGTHKKNEKFSYDIGYLNQFVDRGVKNYQHQLVIYLFF